MVRQLAYTMFVTNNHASFDLYGNQNLVKHQKVSKYYDRDCASCLFAINQSIMFSKIPQNL